LWNFIGRHKYIISLLVFGIIVGFLDENSALRRFGYKREIMQLHEEIAKYKAEYEESTEKLNELNSNPESLEKIAREKYLMKKPNEDIYVFQE
jgi:cell division protein FtsB